MRPISSLSTWRDQIGRAMLNLDFKPWGTEPFAFAIQPLLDHDGVRIVRCRHTPGFLFRDHELLKDGTDSLTLIYPLGSDFTIEHRGVSNRLTASEATLLDNASPGVAGSHLHSDFISILLPRDALSLTEGAIERLLAHKWSHANHSFGLLSNYVKGIGQSRQGLDDTLAATAKRHILELVQHVADTQLNPNTRRPERNDPIFSARLHLMLEDIRQHSHEPDYSVEMLAARHGISLRHAQRQLEAAGVRFTDLVNGYRLDAAYRALTDPKLKDLAISQIVMRVGFSDVSHFNRLFKSRFDTTPRAARTMPLGIR